MPELIDKQASMKAICDGCFKSRAVDIELKCRGTCNVIDILQQQHTINPEVRHGRWVHHNGGYSDHFECTACGEDIVLTGRWRFCPNCGAKMDADHIADGRKKVGGAENG